MTATITNITNQVLPIAQIVKAIKMVDLETSHTFDAVPGFTLRVSFPDLSGIVIERLNQAGDVREADEGCPQRVTVRATYPRTTVIRWVIFGQDDVEEGSAHQFDAALGVALAVLSR